MRTRIILLLLAVTALTVLIAPSASAAPVITRSHFEFAVRVDDCGLTTLDLAIDKTQIVNTSTVNGELFYKLTVVDTGVAIERTTGKTFRFVDRSTQVVKFRIDQPTVDTAERTIVIVGSGGSGLVGRGLVHTTILPDGTITSEVDLHFVRCI